MATYEQVQDRINNEFLDRSDLTAETKTAIKATIRHYERKRFPFNESSTAFATSASVSATTLSTAFFSVDYVRLFYQASASYELTKCAMGDLLNMRAGAIAQGMPTHYALYGLNIEYFPIPDSAWTVTVHGIHQLSALSASSDTNDWLSAAEDLIVYGATKLVWANVLRNKEEAANFQVLEEDAYNVLQEATEQRLATGIRPTKF